MSGISNIRDGRGFRYLVVRIKEAAWISANHMVLHKVVSYIMAYTNILFLDLDAAIMHLPWVLPPLSNCWIIDIPRLYRALNQTATIDC